MGKQTEIEVKPIRPRKYVQLERIDGEQIEASHRHIAGRRFPCEFVGSSSALRAQVCFSKSDEVSVWLWDKAPDRKAGAFTVQALKDWHIDPGTLERMRIYAASQHKAAKKRMGVNTSIGDAT